MALRAFPRAKIIELAAIIERGSSFVDDGARREFGYEIRTWAQAALRGRGPMRPPRFRKGARSRMEKLGRAAEKLTAAIEELEPVEFQELCRYAASAARDRKTSEEAARWASLPPRWLRLVQAMTRFDRNERRAARMGAAIRELPRLFAVAADQAAREATVPKRFPSQVGLAVRDLAVLWKHVTDQAPKAHYNSLDGSRGGAFAEFVRAAVPALWPNRGNLDGMIRDACTYSIQK